MAALTGDGVYNLGQVEQNPILSVLKGTPDAWLVDLLHTCAAGDVTRFAQVSQQHATQIAAQPALTNRATAVQEKMKLIALVWLVFAKPPHERVLEFSEIAEALQRGIKNDETTVINVHVKADAIVLPIVPAGASNSEMMGAKIPKGYFNQ